MKMKSWRVTNRQQLLNVFALCLGLTLALWLGLQTTQAASQNLFAEPKGTGTACSRSEPCTIQTAISQAGKGDIIYAAAGKYIGSGTEVISITKNITLYGGWNGSPFGSIVRDPDVYKSILDGEGERRVVKITGLVTPTVDGFTIANGNATGSIDCEESDADGCGGGIFVRNAYPVITNNTITNNVAAVTMSGYPTRTTGYGGGIYLAQSPRTLIHDNIVFGNVASQANCGSGGGILLNNAYDMTGVRLEMNRFYSNTASVTNDGCAWGGGISGGPDGVLFNYNTISGNQASGFGGGQGAGIYQAYGAADYHGNAIMGNLGIASGQSVLLNCSESRFEGNWVMDNSTTWGIYLVNGSGIQPTLSNNVVKHGGDAAMVFGNNVAYPLTVTLLHNTLIGSGAGKGVYVSSESVALFLTNTIVTSFTWGITNTYPASSTVSADHTLFWANTYDGIRGTNPVDGNPAFLNDVWGYRLSSASAAIDAGVNAGVTTDIDGNSRPKGLGYDIGADEFWWRYLYLPIIMK